MLKQRLKISSLFSIVSLSSNDDEATIIEYLGKPTAYVFDNQYELLNQIPICFNEKLWNLIACLMNSMSYGENLFKTLKRLNII